MFYDGESGIIHKLSVSDVIGYSLLLIQFSVVCIDSF